MNPITLAEDRSLAVPPGQLVITGYIHVDLIRFACRDRMAIGDVHEKYQRRLQLGDHQPWPCPRGHWEDGRFVIVDGRHDALAALMLGQEHILVAWPALASLSPSQAAPSSTTSTPTDTDHAAVNAAGIFAV